MAACPPGRHALTFRISQTIVCFACTYRCSHTQTILVRGIYLYFRSNLHLSKYCLICNVK